MLSGTKYLVLVLLAVVIVVEARRYDEQQLSVQQHHKHRHHHELETPQRWSTSSSSSSSRRRSPKEDEPDDYDYSYDDDDDYEADDEESSLENNYPPSNRHYPRTYPKRHDNVISHYRPRSSSRSPHHPRGYHAYSTSSRFHDRIPHHHKTSSRPVSHRRRYKDEDDYHHRRRYQEDTDDDYESEEQEDHRGKNRGSIPSSKRTHSLVGSGSKGRRSKYEPRRDWRYNLDEEEEEEDDYSGYESDYEDAEEEEEKEDRSSSLFKKHALKKSDLDDTERRRNKFDEWLRRTRLNQSRSHRPSHHRQEESNEHDFWKRFDDDRDYNEIVKTPPKTTWDGILQLLGEDRTTTTTSTTTTTTTRPTTQSRRNSEIEGHLRRDFSKLRWTTSTSSPTKKDYADVQADASTDYAADGVDEEESTSPLTTTTTTTMKPSTTTTTTRSTTSTTTTQRPHVTARRQTTGPTVHNNDNQDQSDYPAMSAHSSYKWKTLGTWDKVEKTRNAMVNQRSRVNKTEMTAAQQNYLKVSNEGKCRWPRVKVIPVRDIHTNSSSNYIPNCVMLHRCSDDTGCCLSETLTCEAKKTQIVEFYFYATHVERRTEVEKLSFVNHTECECREKKHFDNHNLQPNAQDSTTLQNIIRKPCRCTTRFMPKVNGEGECECYCKENDAECLKMHRGKAFLTTKDRHCIINNQCTAPSCAFGLYENSSGRCLRKQEYMEAGR